MDSESAESLKERAGNLQKQIADLASSLKDLNNSARSIPLDSDFHFYNNFPPFRRPVTDLQNRSKSLLRQIGGSQLLWKRPSPYPTDPDVVNEWVENIQDDIFERVDVSMDEFKRVWKAQKEGKPDALGDLESGFQLVYGSKKKAAKSRREAGGSRTMVSTSGNRSSSVQMASRDKKTTSERSRVPFHVPSISRPQDRYSIVVDNSNTPFKHRGLKRSEDGSRYIHPLEEELNKMEFAGDQSEAPEPLQPRPWEKTPFKFVERVQDLNEMAVNLQSSSEIAVDLEHNQYRSYQGLTCLMQISTRLEDFVIDTLILQKHIGPCLRDIFSNPGIKKVMHGADRDILWLQRDFGIYVCNLFDTGQASRVLKLERNSLEFLLQHYCGITADKEYQTADWRLRPLTPEMIKYAREDTHYLLYVHDLMRKNLVSIPAETDEAPLLEVYKRSRYVCLQLYEKELLTETSYLHIYRLHEGNFSQEQLAVIAGIYEWRDRIARIEDESTGYILPNKVLLQIAKVMPNTLQELRSFVKGRHPFVERNLAPLLDIIKNSRETRKIVADLDSKTPLLDSRKGTDELKEMPKINDQPLAVSVDTIVNTVLCHTYDENTLSVDKLNNEVKQAENVESSSAATGTIVNDTLPFKKGGPGSAIVGRASTSLLFNKKGGYKKESLTISNVTENYQASQSPSRQSPCLLSKEAVSLERLEIAITDEEYAKPENLQSIRPVEVSNSRDFVPKRNSATAEGSLHSNIYAQEESTEIRNTGLAEAKVPSIQVQKRPGRGLAAMLGASKFKEKNEESFKMHDPDQDNARNKVEQIKASITLPFQPFFRACEVISTDHSSKSKDLTNQNPSNQESQVDEVVRNENVDSKIEIENTKSDLKKFYGILHGEEGKKHRAWWPPVHDKDTVKASVTAETNHKELPPSLSELRQQKNYKHRSGHQFLRSTLNSNDFRGGKKRKKNSREIRNANKGSAVTSESRSQFKPFDYAAARLWSNMPVKDAKDGNANKKLPVKKGKGLAFDPMNRVARESNADVIQPGKRRQVFPASGNRSATFQ